MIKDITTPTDFLCIYHGNCSDGYSAAWAVKQWADKYNHVVEYFPGKYGEDYPPTNNRHVIIVDFSYDKETMIKMSNFSKSITVLDHHKTAETNIKNLGSVLKCPSDIVFDMSKSGALLTWEYFFNTSPPAMIKHVSDRDIWEFKLENTKAASATIFSYEQTFENWDYIMNSTNYTELINTGSALLRKQNKDVLSLYKATLQYKDIEVDGKLYKNIPIANVPFMFASDLGHMMLEEDTNAQFSLTYFTNSEGEFSFSLRSKNDRVDVSRIAKYYDGGGHRNASGFKSYILPWV